MPSPACWQKPSYHVNASDCLGLGSFPGTRISLRESVPR